MGSYSSPPSTQYQNLKVLCDNTNLDGDILATTGRAIFSYVTFKATAAWNGSLEWQWLDSTDTWQTYANSLPAGSTLWYTLSTDNILGVGHQVTPTPKFPLYTRVVATTAPTLGACNVYLFWYPPPANPLF